MGPGEAHCVATNFFKVQGGHDAKKIVQDVASSGQGSCENASCKYDQTGEGHTVSDAKGTRRLRRCRWSAGASHTPSNLGWLQSEHSEFGKHTSRVIWKSLAHGKSCVFGIFLDRDDLPLDETVCWESIPCRWDVF